MKYSMNIVKKLAFAPLFIAILIILIYWFNPIFKSYDFVFSLSLNTLLDLVIISALISLTCFLFVLFATFASNWKFILPAAAVAGLSTLLFLNPSLGLILAAAVFIALILSYIGLDSALSSYLTFKPEALLGPPIRHLSGLLILAFCLVYFFSASKIIAEKGFQIPDSLIDTVLQFSKSSLPDIQTEQAGLPQISPDQLTLLQKNPELLRQTGLDPKILESLTTSQKNQPPANLTNNLIKQTVKDQIQNFIKPYITFVPAGLAILLFLTLQSLVSILNLLIYPLLWIIFFILEKTGFVKFEIEQRPVKKLVV